MRCIFQHQAQRTIDVLSKKREYITLNLDATLFYKVRQTLTTLQ